MSAAMGVGMFVFDAVPTSTTKPAGGGPAAASRWMLHQAANDGFRGVLLVCFDGPDARDGPRGVVVLANGGRAFCGPAFPPTGIDPSDPQSPEELYAGAWPSTALSPIYDPLLVLSLRAAADKAAIGPLHPPDLTPSSPPGIIMSCCMRRGRHRLCPTPPVPDTPLVSSQATTPPSASSPSCCARCSPAPPPSRRRSPASIGQTSPGAPK